MSRWWLAAYTRSRQERAVSEMLRNKGLTTLLPTYQKFSRWSDRIKRIDAPLFPGYIFVNVDLAERIRVLETAGIVHFVCSAGKALPLRGDEVEFLRTCLARPGDIEPHPYLAVGNRVRIIHGAFAGWEGVLMQKKNSVRVVVAIQQIMQAVALDLHSADVEPVN
jgi:transcription antitermination factor NusG